MVEVGWWRWFVNQERLQGNGFVEQEPLRQWFLYPSYRAVGRYCLETDCYWGYDLPEEERSRTVKRRARMSYSSISINVLKLFGMVWPE